MKTILHFAIGNLLIQKTRFLIDLLKAMIEWVVENYNPYANMAVAILFVQYTLRAWVYVMKLAMIKILYLVQYFDGTGFKH